MNNLNRYRHTAINKACFNLLGDAYGIKLQSVNN